MKWFYHNIYMFIVFLFHCFTKVPKEGHKYEVLFGMVVPYSNPTFILILVFIHANITTVWRIILRKLKLYEWMSDISCALCFPSTNHKAISSFSWHSFSIIYAIFLKTSWKSSQTWTPTESLPKSLLGVFCYIRVILHIYYYIFSSTI